MVLDRDDGLRVKRRSGISVFQPGPGGKRKDRPELFFRSGLTPLSDGLESRPCPMYLLGTGVLGTRAPETPHVTRGCNPLWTGILTGAQLTLSRHYRVGI